MSSKWALNVFSMIVFLVFLYQVSDFMNSYFKYRAVTELTLEIPAEMTLPDLSICIRFSYIFEYERYARDTGINLTNDEPYAFNKIGRLLEVVTVNDLLQYTPNITNNIFKWLIRKPADILFHFNISSECNDFIHVTKYSLQEYVCNRIRLKTYSNSTCYYADIGYSLVYQRLMYAIYISLDGIESANKFHIIVQNNIHNV